MPNMLCPRCWGTKVVSQARLKCAYCNGSGTSADVQLSKNFALSEMLFSNTAIRKQIANDPTAEQVAYLKMVCDLLLEPVREKFGPIHVNSGYRSIGLNRSLGSASPTSVHPKAWAADFIPMAAGVTLKAVVEWIRKSNIVYDQVIYEGTWVHLSIYSPDKRQRKQELMMFGGKYFHYDPKDPRTV